MAKKKTEETAPDDFEGALSNIEAPTRRATDDDLPAEEAANAIRAASSARRAVKSDQNNMTATIERQKRDTFDLFDQVESGKKLDIDKERRGRSETRSQTAARLAAERNRQWTLSVEIEDHETYQYAMLCPHCSKPGIFFLKNPLGKTLHHDDWYSVLKKKNEPWHMSMIPCQQCFIDKGEYMGMAVNPGLSNDTKRGAAFNVSGAFSRFVVKFSKDPEVRKIEGLLDAVMDKPREIGVKTRKMEEAEATQGAF